MSNLSIAILGERASFHHIAANAFFANNDHRIVTCYSFLDLCDKLKSGETDIALMAIENTIAGSIITNYNL